MAFFKEKLNLNKIKKSYPNKNIIVLGTAGSGRCDDLIPCICGTMEKVERKKLMKDNGNKMSVAETEFSKLGFYLLEICH